MTVLKVSAFTEVLNTCKHYKIIGREEKQNPPKWERKEMAAEMRVKQDWYVRTINVRTGWRIINYIISVERETEKAYYAEMEAIRNSDGKSIFFKTWVPKSCTLSIEEYRAEIAQEAADFGLDKDDDKHIRLAEWALVRGLAIHAGFKTNRILEEIAEAGLVAPVEVA
jgi:hypothetical protein